MKEKYLDLLMVNLSYILPLVIAFAFSQYVVLWAWNKLMILNLPQYCNLIK